MGRPISNRCTLQVAAEASLNTLPGSPDWHTMPWKSIGRWGAEVVTAESSPISRNRRRQSSVPVDLNSGVEFEDDLRLSTFRRFIEGFMFATATAPGSTDVAVFSPTAITASVAASKAIDVTGAISLDETITIGSIVYRWRTSGAGLAAAYDVLIEAAVTDSLTNLTNAINGGTGSGTKYHAGTVAHTQVTAVKTDADTVTVTAIIDGTNGNAIVLAETMVNGAWAGGAVALSGGVDGAYTVASGGALPVGTLVVVRGAAIAGNNGLKVVESGSGATSIKVEGDIVAETSVPDHCTVEVAGFQGASGDLEIDANGDLISTALDFTTLDLLAGQCIGIGGDGSTYNFATAANRGLAEIETIAASKLTLGHKDTTFVEDDGAGKTVRIWFGQFVRDVDTDDSEFLERSFQFELAYPNLGSGGATEYEYAKGNYCNELSMSMPLTGIVGVGFNFVGTDTPAPTASRATDANDATEQAQRQVFSTAIHYLRLTVQDEDEAGLTTDFKTWTATIRNGVQAEKVQGTLGAKYMNHGKFMVDIDATMVFSNSAVATRIRDNTLVGFRWALRNEDGAVHFSVPSCRIGQGLRGFPENESVTIQTSLMAEEDETLGYSIGISLFPYLPSDY